MSCDYYETLEINRHATDAEIKKAYRRLALKFHPSRNVEAGSSERFLQLGEAYDVLSDPRKKATYDKFGEVGLRDGIPLELARGGAWSSRYVYHGNPEKTFRQFFGDNNPFADFYTTESPLEFDSLHTGVEKTQDSPIERDLNLSLDDLFHGCIKKIKISRRVEAANISQSCLFSSARCFSGVQSFLSLFPRETAEILGGLVNVRIQITALYIFKV